MAADLCAAACGHADAHAWACESDGCRDSACRKCALGGLSEEADAGEGRPPTRAFDSWYRCSFCARRVCDACGQDEEYWWFCEREGCDALSCPDCSQVGFCDRGGDVPMCFMHMTRCSDCAEFLCETCLEEASACGTCDKIACAACCSRNGGNATCQQEGCDEESCRACATVRPCACGDSERCDAHVHACAAGACDARLGACCEPHSHLKRLRKGGVALVARAYGGAAGRDDAQ